MTDSDIKFELDSDGYGYAFNGNGRVLIVSDEQDEDLLYKAKDSIEQIYDDLWEDEDGDWEEDPCPVYEFNGISIHDIQDQMEDEEITMTSFGKDSSALIKSSDPSQTLVLMPLLL